MHGPGWIVESEPLLTVTRWSESEHWYRVGDLCQRGCGRLGVEMMLLKPRLPLVAGRWLRGQCLPSMGRAHKTSHGHTSVIPALRQYLLRLAAPPTHLACPAIGERPCLKVGSQDLHVRLSSDLHICAPSLLHMSTNTQHTKLSLKGIGHNGTSL